MNTLVRKGLPLSSLALLVHSTVYAEPKNDLDTVIVTGTKIQTTIADSATTMWVIDQKELEKHINAGTDLKGALGRLIPGFDFGSGSRTNYSQNLRGRSALVMIDGVSLNSTREISRQFDSIDPFNIARVEVLSGATALFGAGASGGIINIITKKGESGDTKVEARVGGVSGFNSSEDLTKQAALAISGGNDTVAGRLSVAYEGKGAAYDGDGNMIMPDITQTDMQFNQAIDVMGNLEVNIDEQQSLSLTAQYYDSQQDTEYGAYLGPNLAGLFGFPELIEIRKGLKLDEQPNTERVFVNAQYKHDSVLDHALLAQLYYRSESLGFFPFPDTTTPMYGSSVQDTSIFGGKLMLQKEWQDVALNYGGEYASETFSAKQRVFDLQKAMASGAMEFEKLRELQRYPDIDTQNAALFAQANWRVAEDWLLTGGVRYQKTSFDVSDFVGLSQQEYVAAGLLSGADAIPGGSSSTDVWLFNAGGVYDLADSQQLWANFSQGFNVPDPAKFYGRGSYDLTSNPGRATLTNSVNINNTPLPGVKTNSIELGWRANGTSYRTQVAGYYSLSDKTQRINTSDLTLDVDNEESRIYGIEGQFDYYFTQNIYAGVQGQWIRSEEKNQGAWQDMTVQFASPSSAVTRVGYDNLDYGVEVFLQSLADYEDADNNKLNGYNIAGLSSYYMLPVGQINFGIENLFNTTYETIWSQRAQVLYSAVSAPELFKYNGQGRTFALSYSAEF
ncbi:aerobactin siderophore receptor IutA [Vibrio maritimus]|uniref:Ferric aerobactin receptor n=1 Tax=Vibrio maritimus TaxID=990268 RepID=A0A090RZ13_9VIBR|nr:aerobactin siderophore receptor IutA [Vibrio maritimus]